MRTKTLLLTAALTAAGVATSMAQVYSVNMVGYINTSVPTSFSMIANHLNASPNNKVTTLLPAPPDNTQVYKFNPSTGGYDSITYISGIGWDDGGAGSIDMTLGPGEGAFFFADTAFTATFVGEVQLASAVSVVPGFQIISSALPQSLQLDGNPNDGNPSPPTGLGFPIADGDQVYQYNGATGGYNFSEYILGIGWNTDTGSPPAPAVGESFFFYGGAAGGASRSWSRNFVVGVD